MIYDFRCGRCRHTVEIIKSATELEWREGCPVCGQAMSKVFTFNGHVSCGTFEPHFNWAFGKEVTTRRALYNEKRRYEGETGKTLYEVGNEKPKLKPTRKAYTLD